MKILKIAFVGAPQSGKSSLIEYLRNELKKEYQVVIADEPPTILLKAGLNPPYNMSGLEFQKECLEEYIRVYKRIDDHMEMFEENGKDVIILYDTLPSIGQCYLKSKDSAEYNAWKASYDSMAQYYKDHQPDFTFITDTLNPTYSPDGNAVRRELENQKIWSITDKVNKLYEDAEHLSNQLSLEERASVVLNKIDNYFNPKSYTVTFNNCKITALISLSCPNCDWHDAVDYYHPYRYCPMCGTYLDGIYPNDSTNPLDPLGLEARRKMFYVDPDKLPRYISNTTCSNN